mgnify:CR=1 FL=1
MTYAILKPDSEFPLGFMTSDIPPSVDELADALAKQLWLSDRDALVDLYPNLMLGWAIVH